MKNLTNLFFIILFSGILVTGCKEAEELFYVNFYADYETEFDVTIPSGSMTKSISGSFSVNETIDPTTNSDYQLYIDNIKEVDIHEVSGEVISISKNVTLETCILEVSNTANTATWVFNNEPIQVGTVLTLDNNQGQWDEMTAIMLGRIPFEVNISGSVDDEDIEFTVLFTLKSEVTASPID